MDRFNSQETHKIEVMKAVKESPQSTVSGANADRFFQETSFGRTAADIAREANRQGSHEEVIHLLASGVRCVSPKDVKNLAGTQ